MIIPDDAYPYLVAQQGALDVLRQDRAAWTRAYLRQMDGLLGNVQRFLPEKLESVLDIGGGVGGFDALLNASRGGGLTISILDGVNDPPVVINHDKPFNNMKVTAEFLTANGVKNFRPQSPKALFDHEPFDLVVSFASWCFHYPPDVYLDFVRRCCHAQTILILDVRRGRPGWSEALHKPFRCIDIAEHAGKYDRFVMTPRG